MPQRSNEIVFAVFAIAVLTGLVVALGRSGAWLLLLIVLAMIIRSKVTQTQGA